MSETQEIKIPVRNGIYLSSVLASDKPALLEHLSSKEVHETTLTIPYPYSEADADDWLQKRITHNSKQGKPVSFAIRDADAKLIGVIGADSFELGNTHKAEIGYWLAPKYWGKGIMSDAVRAYIGYAFGELRLLKLVAHVFETNAGSARVLEHNGFQLEGRLRKHFSKDGKLMDARIYGLLKEDVA